MADNNKNKITVKFAPGVIEDLQEQMTPEELQQFMDAIAELQETGDFEQVFDGGEQVDMQKLEKEDPELFKTLQEQLEGCYSNKDETLH